MVAVTTVTAPLEAVDVYVVVCGFCGRVVEDVVLVGAGVVSVSGLELWGRVVVEVEIEGVVSGFGVVRGSCVVGVLEVVTGGVVVVVVVGPAVVPFPPACLLAIRTREVASGGLARWTASIAEWSDS